MPNEMRLAIADLEARLQSRIVRLAGLKRSMADLIGAEEGASFNDLQKKNAELRQELTEHRSHIAVLNQRVDDLTFSETFLPKSDLVHTYDLDHDDDDRSSLSNSPATSLLSLNLQNLNLNRTTKSFNFPDTAKPSEAGNNPHKPQSPLTNGTPSPTSKESAQEVITKPKRKKTRKPVVDNPLKIVESDDSDKYEWDFEKAMEEDDEDAEELEEKIPVIPHPRWDEFDEDDNIAEKKFKRTELYIDMSSSGDGSHSDKSDEVD